MRGKIIHLCNTSSICVLLKGECPRCEKFKTQILPDLIDILERIDTNFYVYNFEEETEDSIPSWLQNRANHKILPLVFVVTNDVINNNYNNCLNEEIVFYSGDIGEIIELERWIRHAIKEVVPHDCYCMDRVYSVSFKRIVMQ